MAAAAVTAVHIIPATAQSFPNRPIRIVVPYPPGGSNGIMGRLAAQKLTEAFGVQVVIDNRGGGNGVIGTEIIQRAPPDGHSMLITSTNFDAKSLRGMLAPRGTPKPIVDRWSAELQKILRMPDIVEKMAGQGMGPFFMTPAAFQTWMRSEFAKYAQVLRTVEIKGER
jgi:tripartite-type tricarboxylate transporter receptor subunit TctC